MHVHTHLGKLESVRTRSALRRKSKHLLGRIAVSAKIKNTMYVRDSYTTFEHMQGVQQIKVKVFIYYRVGRGADGGVDGR